MKIRIIIYFLLLLSLPVQLHAKTKRALVIGLGEQQDRAWKKINGDKDVLFVQAMLKNAGFNSLWWAERLKSENRTRRILARWSLPF